MRGFDVARGVAERHAVRVTRQRLDRFPYPDTAKLAIARRLRRDPTPAKRLAWSLLRKRGILGLKFRRQHVLRGFIVDFYCPRLRLVLELDGTVHAQPAQAGVDVARTAFLEARGYRVVRVRNPEVSRERLECLLRQFIQDDAYPLSR